MRAEVIKQHRNSFHSYGVYFTLLIWPIVVFFNAYYSYKPFNLSQGPWNTFASQEDIIMFLITGFLGYISFKSLLQSAFYMGHERINGTLETIFLTPANRIAIIYGRAFGALIENIWMFSVFCVFVTVWIRRIPVESLIYIPISFIVLIVSAAVWGGLMNVIFLFSRDASFLMAVFDEPMILFSGVRMPTFVFPIWAKIISALFPLTYALMIVRPLLIEGSLSASLQGIYKLLISLLLIVSLTLWLLKKAEKNARKNGNFVFY
ncbi:MAG: Efflux ABC transporter, permease protein [Firmicutes bacterium]|nr:Efflux ABC transporter, permease protein [Bacillota bacterium]